MFRIIRTCHCWKYRQDRLHLKCYHNTATQNTAFFYKTSKITFLKFYLQINNGAGPWRHVSLLSQILATIEDGADKVQ